ncbi:MAG: adenylate/guanylate cyclase domain-containing protein, partial [Croceibacterium sp.]
ILAVFPAANFAGRAEACQAALAAVAEAEKGLAELNVRRGESSDPPVAHGIGLHYGDTLYGNIGVVERLDFTVIGREVNVASRIEGMTKQLGCSPICSAAFIEYAGVAAEPLGSFELRGVAEPVELFRLKNG